MSNSFKRWVEVKGAKEYAEAMKRVKKGVKKNMTARLRIVGNLVRDKERVAAASKFTHPTGRLKRGIQTRVSSSFDVRVLNGAKDKRTNTYRYPRRLEFDKAYGGRYAFFYPTWERMKPAATAELSKVLKDVEADYK